MIKPNLFLISLHEREERMRLTWFTTLEGIASETSGAGANRRVIDNITNSIYATSARAWVHTTLVVTGKVLWTV